MLAVLQDKPGDPDVLYMGQVDKPTLGDNDVLIKVDAVSVNRADTLQRRGLYPVPAGVSQVLGLECAGHVAEVGRLVTRVSRGQAVMALLSGGGYAEHVSVHCGHVMSVPRGLSMDQAAAIPEVWLTAYQLLHSVARIRAGHRVLVHAGGSGVGTAAVQLVRLAGAQSFVTAGSDTKVEKAVSLGASGGCNYKTSSWREAVTSWTGDQGVDIILDCIGGSYAEDNLACLAVDGTWVLYGLMGGAEVSGPVLGGLLRKRGALKATTLRSRSDEYKTELVENFTKDCLKHFEGPAPSLVPVVDRVMNIKQVATAHTLMEQNKNTGKIVLTMK